MPGTPGASRARTAGSNRRNEDARQRSRGWVADDYDDVFPTAFFAADGKDEEDA